MKYPRAEHQRPLPHTCERPVYNPYSPKRTLNPNWKWKNDKLVFGSKPRDLSGVVDIALTNAEGLSGLSAAIGGLIIVYENGHVQYASTFRVGPQKWLTADHNTHPEEVSGSMIEHLYVTTELELPFQQQRGIDDILQELGTFYACTKIALPHRAQQDVDPRSGLAWHVENDFCFLHVPDDTSTIYMFPTGVELKEKDAVGVFGYHMPINQTYIVDAFGKDEFTVTKICDIFNGFNRKSLSPGQLLAPLTRENCFDLQLINHSCSSLPGSSGSVCGMLASPGYFIGVHIGSWSKPSVAENNYNLMLSIHHAEFADAYFNVVYPFLSDVDKLRVQSYKDRHTK
ncbi:lysophospholipase [Acrasis kona]|uniref:Lysophospholipase n=1 Tax=Acrasis kona TaxID=1008807 RepID=A0AAW2YQ42_9EUKA